MKSIRLKAIRVLGWLIGGLASLAAILLLTLAVYLLLFDYPEHIRAWMERETSRVVEREVTIGRFSVYLPNTFELGNVRAESKGGGPPWLELERLRAELNFSRVLHGELRLSLLHVTGLTVRVQDYGKGQVDLPGMWEPGTPRASVTPVVPRARFSLLADRILLDGATFVYNNLNLPWRLDAFELAAGLERDGSIYQGTLNYRQGEFQIKGRPPVEGGIAARVELEGGTLRVSELTALGSFYDLRATGDVSFGKDPRADFELDLDARLGPASRSLLGTSRLTGPIDSPATFQGTLSLGRGWHLVRGTVEVPDATLAGIPLQNWTGDLTWDRKVFKLESATGRIAGGRSSLEVQQALPLAGLPAEMKLDLEDMSLATLVTANRGVSRESAPLDSLVSGHALLEFPASDLSRVSGNFELRGKFKEPPDELEHEMIEFSVSGALDDGSLSLSPSRFRGEFFSATLEGVYPHRGSANLQLDLDTRDLDRSDRLQQNLRTLLHPTRPAKLLGVEGAARIRGVLTERIPKLVLKGEARGTDVKFRGIPWGNVVARGTLSGERIAFRELQARKGQGWLRGQGELRFAPQLFSHWSFKGGAGQWPARDFQSLLDLPLGVEALLSGEAHFISEAGRLIGEGSLRLGLGTLSGYAFDSAETGVELAGRQITLNRASIRRGNAQLNGRAQFDLETRGMEGHVIARRFSLAEWMGERFDLDGEVNGEIEIGGTRDSPAIEIEASSPAVSLGGEDLGQTSLRASVQGESIRGKLSVQGEPFELEANARSRLSPGFPTTGDARWGGADLGHWLRSLGYGIPETFRLATDGTASVEGKLTSLEDLFVDAILDTVQFDVDGYRLESLKPSKVHLRKGNLEVGNLLLAGEDTRVELTGSLPVGEGSLDVQALGSVNLELMESFYPSISSSGTVGLSARARGTWERPSLSGHADFTSGVLRIQGFPQALGDIHGRVLFDNRTVRVPDIQARFGGAPVQVSGTLLLEDLKPYSFELEASGRELRLRYPEGLVATLDADISLNGIAESPTLSGRIDISDAVWSREYDLATGILIDRDAEDFDLLEDFSQEGPLSNLRFDVEIQVPGTLRVKNSRATIEATAELELQGTYTRPVLLGRAEATRGEVFLLGQTYRLVSGRVEFIDPTSMKPFFDLVAESRVRSYRVVLRLTGTPERFFPELSSDPPLRTVDILRLLAGASERDILVGSEEEEIAGVGVASLLTERLTQEVGRRAERLFGLDRFSIDPFLVGQFANPTARVSIAKQIYKDLSVSYSTNLSEASETLILVEYTPQGPISWIISRDEEGAYGVDLRFRKSF